MQVTVPRRGGTSSKRDPNIRAIVLFRENLGTEGEVRALTADLREVMGSRALIGIDQEGGAVVRATFLPQPPADPSRPTAARQEFPEERWSGS